MGDSFSTGMKIVGSTISSVVGTGLNVAGSLIHGDIGGAFNNVVDGIDTGVSRIKSYASGGDGDGVSGIQHLSNSINNINSIVPLNTALSTVTANAPDSVKKMAGVAASFHDGLQKYGDVTAAARHAGSSPITKSLADSMSNHVATALQKHTGINARLEQTIANPVSKHANMTSSVSGQHQAAKDMVSGPGVEALAMKHAAKVFSSGNGGATPPTLLVGAGG